MLARVTAIMTASCFTAAFGSHEFGPEQALGLVLIMHAASQSQVLERRLAAARHGADVIELEPCLLFAAMPLIANERASRAVALPDFASDLGRDMPALGLASLNTRVLDGSELLLLEIAHQRLQGTLEHFGDITRGYGVTEKRLSLTEQLARLLIDGDL